jgi:lactoylglutathione lyase
MLEIGGVAHVGVRVSNAERALAFYRKLGFELCYADDKDPVFVVRNAAGVEVNLIANGGDEDRAPNVLMDIPAKHAGWTHVAFRVSSIEQAIAELRAAEIALSEGPVRLGPGVSCFVRDPDRNVIELRQED